MPPIPILIPNHILDVNGRPGLEDVADRPSTQWTLAPRPAAHAPQVPVPLPPSPSSALARRELGGPPSIDIDRLHPGAAHAPPHNAVAARAHWVPQHVSQAPIFPDGAGNVSPSHDPRWRQPSLRCFPFVNSRAPAPNMTLLEDDRVPNGHEMYMVRRDSRQVTTFESAPAHAQLTDEDWAPFCAMWLATAHLYAHVEVALDVSVNPQLRSEQEDVPEDDRATTDEFLGDREYSHTGVDVSVSAAMAGDDQALNRAATEQMARAFLANAVGLDTSVPAPPHPSVAHVHVHARPQPRRPRARPSVGPARDHPAKCPQCGRVPTDADLGEWRMGRVSREMVCNACGQYERRTGRVRPRELEKMRRRGNGVRVYKTANCKSGLVL